MFHVGYNGRTSQGDSEIQDRDCHGKASGLSQMRGGCRSGENYRFMSQWSGAWPAGSDSSAPKCPYFHENTHTRALVFCLKDTDFELLYVAFFPNFQILMESSWL